MSSKTRIYVVTDVDDAHDKRLVRAVSSAQAIAFVTKPRFEAAVASQNDLVELVAAGVTVKDAAVE